MNPFDLHVHTALSACAENALSPRRIVERAHQNGVRLVGITDHNASANVRPAIEAGQRCGVVVLPGVEITSREEAHVLVFFDHIDALDEWQTVIDAHLPEESNITEVFGHQLLYDARDEIVDVDERLRQVGVSLGLDQLVREIHERGGIVIPAHVNRPRHSLTSQLGLIDPNAGFDALEIRWRDWCRDKHRLGDRLHGYPLLTGSDAHFLEDVGRVALELTAGPEEVAHITALTTAIKEMAA